MNTLEFLSHLRTLKIKLWLDSGRLRYSAPRGVMSAEIQAELMRRKGELLAFFGEESEQFAPARREKSSGTPLLASFPQQRLWFLQQLMPKSSLYNVPIALEVSGPLNVQALHASMQTIIERHEVLRTTFQFANGQVIQLIAEQCSLEIPLIDLEILAPQQQQMALTQLIAWQTQPPFHLSADPLLRLALLRFSQHKHIFLITTHHIAVDGWSKGVFLQELFTLYQAYRRGLPSPLAPLPLQYADYALWQREWLQGDSRTRQLTYWKQRLAGAPPFFTIPTDHPRPKQAGASGAAFSLPLESTRNALIRTVSQQEYTTPITTLLAAFQVLLAYYTGQYDIVIGMAIAGRNHTSLEGLVGCFINMLVLRTDLSGNISFREVLRRVKETALGAYANQDLPFEQLVEELKPVRNSSYSPLFQIEYAPQPAMASQLNLDGLTFQQIKSTEISVKFDISLDILEEDTSFHATFKYNRDLFEASTIERMASNYLHLLDRVLVNLDASLEDLKQFFRDSLPERTISSDVAIEERLPIPVENDRSLLSTTGDHLSKPTGISAQPNKELEQLITDVWREVLQIDQIDTHQNFFDLGGHSLLTIELANRLGNVLKQEINLIELFHYPTISSFAANLQKAGEDTVVSQEITERTQKQKEAFKKLKMRKYAP